MGPPNGPGSHVNETVNGWRWTGDPHSEVNGWAPPSGYTGSTSSGGSSGGGNEVDQLLKNTIQAYNDQAQQYSKRYADYTANNPFVYDQVLSDESKKASSRLDPYYSQTLGDFLTGVNIQKSRSLEDERNLLTNLQGNADRYVSQAQGELGTEQENTGQQFESAGLADSGLRERAQGNNLNDTNANIANYLAPNAFQQQQARIQTGRTVNQDLPLATSLEERNLNAQKYNDVKSQALTATNQAQNQYQFGLQQAVGAPPGVTPSQQSSGLSSILNGYTGGGA